MQRRIALGLVASLAAALPAAAQQNFDSVQVRVVPIVKGVAMLVGSGGNLAVAWGEDAAFLVDDQFAPLTPKILAAISSLTPMPVKFVLNTHWHGDHTGGNENLGQAGALIFANDNVRVRMASEQFIELLKSHVPASPKGALPVVTFNDAVTFHLNGDEINAFHVAPAHTDGDAIVFFRKANAIHMGDLFFNGQYPFVDLSSGGSFEGVIDAVNHVLPMINDETKVIPGHGPLASKADLAKYRDVLVVARDRVRRLIAQKKTVEEIVAAKPLADFDATWGSGFITPEVFLRIVYSSLTATR